MLTVLLLFSFIHVSWTTNPDDSLPEYMRGINWGKVEQHLKEDLRLSDDVIPFHYAIELSVNVRGHEDAKRSDFNGTVTINLNFTKATGKIELHSNGLTIEKVVLLESVVLKPPPSVRNFVLNKYRETIVIYLNRTIASGEEFYLQISYSGVAKMNEYGLYENWDPKFNATYDHTGPFVLATNNFPTGARFWFPCFDEPQRQATFQLHVNHPKKLNVYSNTEIERTEPSENSGRITSVFVKTHLLSTYQLALSVNHFPSEDLGALHGFSRVRVISSSDIPEKSIREYDPLNIIRFNLEHLSNSTSAMHRKGNLDIIFVDGTFLITVNPGIMTIGRYNIFRDFYGKKPISNFTNLLIGNHISIRSTDQMWLNDMFVLFYDYEALYPESEISYFQLTRDITNAVLYSSIHERPLRNTIEQFSPTTRQYLTAKRQEPAIKGHQLLRAVHRMCPAAKGGFEKYIMESRGKFADIDRFIEIVSQSCENPALVKEFLSDFVDQPGRAFLTVTRNNETVTIKQTRYLSVGFDERLRDKKTRYTIPLFYKVDGIEFMKIFLKNESHLSIPVRHNSTFAIDSQYDRLYHVFYKDFPKFENTTKDYHLQNNVRKSLLAALEQGAINFDEFVKHATHYVEGRVIDKMISLFLRQVREIFSLGHGSSIIETQQHYCEYRMEITFWESLFNNGTRYWMTRALFANDEDTYRLQTSEENLLDDLYCTEEWLNTTTYTKFLGDNFLGDSNIVRPSLLRQLGRRSEWGDQWNELHQFFFHNVHNFTDPIWNNLAYFVLNDGGSWGSHPDPLVQDDYLAELRNFVIRNPRKAAPMSDEIEMRLEQHYIRKERAKALGADSSKLSDARGDLINVFIKH